MKKHIYNQPQTIVLSISMTVSMMVGSGGPDPTPGMDVIEAADPITAR